MGPVLDALLQALDAAARDLSAGDAEESERRARTLAALSRVAESLDRLLRLRRAEAEEHSSERSAREAAARQRDADVWREIEGRLARLRAAQSASADRETTWPGQAGAAPG
jgi:glutathione S-transferase